MRRFTIDSAVLGTSKHIVGDSEGFVWSETVPRDSWHLTGHIKSSPTAKCLDTLLTICQHSVAKVPQRYINSLNCLLSGSQDPVIPWRYALPQSEFRLFFKNLVQETTDVFSSLPFDYYETAWIPGNRVLNALKPARVDTKKFDLHVSGEGQASPGLESFRPKKSGFAQNVVYDRFSTRTGRLTVTDGPNILVLKKTFRDVLTSTHEGGTIVSLDFKALEARIVLAESGKYADDEDIYQEISTKQFKGILPRDVVKTAVLAELYGISRGSLKSRLGISEQKLDSFINVIKTHFGVELLRARLKSQLESSGKILNRFGRPLSVPVGQDNLLVNTYAQSSGVDVAMIGFDSILARLGSDGIRPLFVLHDAIILDVREDRLQDVKGVKDVRIPTYDKHFPLKFEQLNEV